MFTDQKASERARGIGASRSSRALRALSVAPLAAMMSLVAAPLAAQQPADTARVHVVRPGDTLWDLARQYLGNPYLWREIYGVNRGTVADPHWIYPLERLRIPGLTPTAPGGLAGTPVGAPAPSGEVSGQEAPAALAAQQPVPAHTVFYDAERYEARAAAVEGVAPQAPSVMTQGEYYRAGLLRRESDLPAVGRVVDVLSATVVPLVSTPQIAPYERIVVKLNGAAPVRVGDRLHFFRAGRRVRPYGRIFRSTGLATVTAIDGAVATVVVDQLFDQLNIGDVATVATEFEPPRGSGPEPVMGPVASVVAFEVPHPLAQRHDLVYVNAGDASGVKEGDEFVAFLPAEREGWGVRPEERVARLQVVRVGPTTSALQVLAVEQPALAVGVPVRLVGKMP